MEMLSDNIAMENNGINNGIMLARNDGIINLTLQEVTKLPSLISPIIMTLGTKCLDDSYEGNFELDFFEVEKKLEYNKVIKYKDIIKENSLYFTLCDDELNIYDNSNIGSKKKILRCVKNWYLEHRGQIFLDLRDIIKDDIDKVRDNADYLIDKVKQSIIDNVIQSLNFNLSSEELDLGVTCFTCYCFMKCKILEKPLWLLI